MRRIAIVIAAMVTFMVFASTVQAATPAEIQLSIDSGLAWLARQQSDIDSSWGTSDKVAHTGLAVKKFEHFALFGDPEHPINPLDPTYIYYKQVKGGLNYLFSQAAIMSSLPKQTHDLVEDNPDPDGDGGVYFLGGGDRKIYETSIALMAIAESDCRDSLVEKVGSDVYGQSYKDVAQDIVDYLAFGQCDAGNGRGGWRYDPNEQSDFSVTGYAYIGLAYAEAAKPDGFDLTIPEFVKKEVKYWQDYAQCAVSGGTGDDGGAGYMSPCSIVNLLKTGNWLLGDAFCGSPDPGDLNRALAYIARTWSSPTPSPGWVNSWQATYCLMKGFEFHGYSNLIPGPTPGSTIDWYQEFADAILAAQIDIYGGLPDRGSWNNCESYGGGIPSYVPNGRF